MGRCCVYKCKNRIEKNLKKVGVAFHRFPRDEKLRALWIEAVRRDNWEPKCYSFICTEHFDTDVVDNTYISGPRLRKNAVPSIFPGFPSHLPPKKPKPPFVERKSASEELLGLSADTPVPYASAALNVPTTTDASVQVVELKKIVHQLTNENNHLVWRLQQATDAMQKKNADLKNIKEQNRLKDAIISHLKELLTKKSQNLIDPLMSKE